MTFTKKLQIIGLLCAGVAFSFVTVAADARPTMTQIQADVETVIIPTALELEELIKSADAGDSAAQLRLGDFYYLSSDTSKNYTLAIQRYRQAAAKKMPEAQFNLGNAFDFGYGVPQDDAEAFKWYLLAADQGHLRAQFSVGAFFNKGRGVAKDDVAAVRWFEKAADRGYPPAQFNLGNMYADGRGVKQDAGRAIEFYRQSAKAGYTEAQVNMATAYAAGKIVKPNLKYAYKWYAIAALSESPFQSFALQGLRYLENKLSESAKKAAQADAEECLKLGLNECK